MNALISNLIVGIAIAASACYCVWRLGPSRLREALRRQLCKALPRWFDAPVSAPGNACDACGGCALAAKPARRRSSTVTLPARIGKRR
jgi:hypothetical protein